jgi:hypothetical protein
MSLHTGLLRVEDWNNVIQDNSVVFLLHSSCEIGAHLAKSIASGISYTWVRVLKCWDHEVQYVVELANHEITATLRDGGDCHQRGMAISPGGRRHHPRYPVEGRRQNDFTAKFVS